MEIKAEGVEVPFFLCVCVCVCVCVCARARARLILKNHHKSVLSYFPGGNSVYLSLRRLYLVQNLVVTIEFLFS